MTSLVKVVNGSVISVGIPCDTRAVRPLVETCRDFLAQQGADSETIISCELALAEACNNAIEYAEQAKMASPVAIQIVWTSESLEIQVNDHTPGFVWPDEIVLPGPDAESGRGLFIICSLMDEAVYYRGSNGNCLQLRKRHSSNSSGRNPDPASPKTQTREASERTRSAYLPVPSTSQAVGFNLENRLVAHELQVARSIQQSLLPQTIPALPGFGLAGYCLSAREVGGDFYDILPLAHENVLLVVADVMGKGVPAALFAATFRTLLRTMAELATRPAELLGRINRLMFSELSGVDMFITAQLALVQTQEARLILASAGHCPALYTNESGETRTLSPEGMPLGILREAAYKEETISLHDGARLVFYTDGVIETRNDKGEFLGQAKILEWLTQGASLRLGASEMKDMFLAGLQQFQGPTPPTDDQTLLFLQHKHVLPDIPEMLPGTGTLVEVP